MTERTPPVADEHTPTDPLADLSDEDGDTIAQEAWDAAHQRYGDDTFSHPADRALARVAFTEGWAAHLAAVVLASDTPTSGAYEVWDGSGGEAPPTNDPFAAPGVTLGGASDTTTATDRDQDRQDVWHWAESVAANGYVTAEGVDALLDRLAHPAASGVTLGGTTREQVDALERLRLWAIAGGSAGDQADTWAATVRAALRPVPAPDDQQGVDQ